MITWGDVVDIILETFNIKQTKLADLLGYKKDAISKMKHGKMEPSSSLSNEDIFNQVFYPATANSPAYKYGDTDNLAPCLEAVKDTINDKKTPFPAVREAMDDMWDETDYKKFVCKLLSRAKKGPSSKIKPKEAETENSNDNGEDAAAFDSTSNEILDTKPEKAPPKEMPSDQMREIFAEAVAEYNIAFYVYSLPDFLRTGFYYAFDIEHFIDVIQSDVLPKFINFQKETVYEEISQFAKTLDSYRRFGEFIDPQFSETYGDMLKEYKVNATLKRVEEEHTDLTNKLIEEKSRDGGQDTSFLFELNSNIWQLKCIRSVLNDYKQLDELYSKIFPGMTLLVF